MKERLAGQVSSIKEWFERSTRVLDESDSGFAPKDGMYTAAQQVAHAAQTIDWFFDGAFNSGGFNMDFEKMDKEIRAVTSLKLAREWFDRSIQTATAGVEAHSDEEWNSPLPEGPIMGGLPRASIMGAILDHSAHHRGALTVYSRLLGKVPPMPYMEM